MPDDNEYDRFLADIERAEKALRPPQFSDRPIQAAPFNGMTPREYEDAKQRRLDPGESITLGAGTLYLQRFDGEGFVELGKIDEPVTFFDNRKMIDAARAFGESLKRVTREIVIHGVLHELSEEWLRQLERLLAKRRYRSKRQKQFYPKRRTRSMKGK